jgi:hypothetical protein
MSPMKPIFAATAALALMAGAAHADPSRVQDAAARFAAEPAPQPLLKPQPAGPTASLSDPGLFLASVRDDDAEPTRPRGTVQTAVDRQFSKTASAALGYLCGLQPSPNTSGGVASSYEARGTFLGGQFKVAF